jgi:hypothetical protein
MLTALVYVLFLALCIAGLRAWRRQTVTAPVETEPLIA